MQARERGVEKGFEWFGFDGEIGSGEDRGRVC